jgi:hypothetical protein
MNSGQESRAPPDVNFHLRPKTVNYLVTSFNLQTVKTSTQITVLRLQFLPDAGE